MESLPVPSVQAMEAATGGTNVPPRYLRPEAAADAVVAGRLRPPSLTSRDFLTPTRNLHASMEPARSGASFRFVSFHFPLQLIRL
jgi:hypothetical protein